MTDILSELEAALEAATVGPWSRDQVYPLVAPTKIDGYTFPAARAADKAQTDADIALICLLRNETPKLIERVRKAEQDARTGYSLYRSEQAEKNRIENALEQAESRLRDAHDELQLRRDELDEAQKFYRAVEELADKWAQGVNIDYPTGLSGRRDAALYLRQALGQVPGGEQ